MQLNPHQEQVGQTTSEAGSSRSPARARAKPARSPSGPAGSFAALASAGTNNSLPDLTNKGGDQMQGRLADAFGAAADKVFISNFHGLCGTVLRRMGAPLGYSVRMTVLVRRR